jgi:hypothetical protein
MDNNSNVEFGHLSLVVSILTGIISWIGTIDVSEFIKSTAGVVAIAAGIMAIRYYYFATIKARK